MWLKGHFLFFLTKLMTIFIYFVEFLISKFFIFGKRVILKEVKNSFISGKLVILNKRGLVKKKNDQQMSFKGSNFKK
jgi:hypothetical protein